MLQIYVYLRFNKLHEIYIYAAMPADGSNPPSPGCRLHAEQPGTGRGFLFQARRGLIYCAASPTRTASDPSSTDQPPSHGSPGFGVAGARVGTALVLLGRRI